MLTLAIFQHNYVFTSVLYILCICACSQITIHRKILAWKKLVNLANREVFTKIFLTNIFTDTPKLYFAYALILAYSSNFSSPTAFTCIVHQHFPHQNSPMCSTSNSFWTLSYLSEVIINCAFQFVEQLCSYVAQ